MKVLSIAVAPAKYWKAPSAGPQLDVLLLDDGQERASTLAAKTAADFGLPLTAVAGPRSPGAGWSTASRRR